MAAVDCDERAQQALQLTTPRTQPQDECDVNQNTCQHAGNDHGWHVKGRGNVAGNTPIAQQNWTICMECSDHVERQPLYKGFIGYLTRLPKGTETRRWRGYWTRMCGDCEICEQLLIFQRTGTGPPGIAGLIPPPAVSAANQARMFDYPLRTCVCWNQFDDGLVMCLEHRKQTVEALRQTFDQDRDANKRWLESIANNPAGVTCTAREGLRMERADRRDWRACRCGNEVVAANVARIYQCMTCEGTWKPRWKTDVPIPAVILPLHRHNSATAPGNFALRRPGVSPALVGRTIENALAAVNGIDVCYLAGCAAWSSFGIQCYATVGLLSFWDAAKLGPRFGCTCADVIS